MVDQDLGLDSDLLEEEYWNITFGTPVNLEATRIYNIKRRNQSPWHTNFIDPIVTNRKTQFIGFSEGGNPDTEDNQPSAIVPFRVFIPLTPRMEYLVPDIPYDKENYNKKLVEYWAYNGEVPGRGEDKIWMWILH